MSKLQSAEEVATEISKRWTPYWDALEIIKARDDEVRRVCADVYVEFVDLHESWDSHEPINAILNAGKVDDKRERLAKALWEADHHCGSWEEVDTPLFGMDSNSDASDTVSFDTIDELFVDLGLDTPLKDDAHPRRTQMSLLERLRLFWWDYYEKPLTIWYPKEDTDV